MESELNHTKSELLNTKITYDDYRRTNEAKIRKLREMNDKLFMLLDESEKLLKGTYKLVIFAYGIGIFLFFNFFMTLLFSETRLSYSSSSLFQVYILKNSILVYNNIYLAVIFLQFLVVFEFWNSLVNIQFD